MKKSILLPLLLLLSAPILNARNTPLPYRNITTFTSLQPQGLCTVQYVHPTTLKVTTSPITTADHDKLLKATFDHRYIARCIITPTNQVKVTLHHR